MRGISIACFFLLFAFTLPSAAQTPEAPAPTRPKNLILIIGDGMGPQQLGLLLLYEHYVSKQEGRSLNISRFIEGASSGFMLPAPVDGLVIDSGCSASELATGQSGVLEGLGVDHAGRMLPTILEKARAAGKSTGLVSDTRITHATPAAFAVHARHRSYESDIAPQLLSNKVDLMLSAGLEYFLPANVINPKSPARRWFTARFGSEIDPPSRRLDGQNLLQQAMEDGYKVVLNRSEMNTATTLPLLGLFAERYLPDAVREFSMRDLPSRRVPLLREMSDTALRLLSSNENGFFLMIEAGQIDWAAHANDAGWLLHEMMRLDDVLGSVLTWSQRRDDTLVILTADHETGAFGFSYQASEEPSALLVPLADQANDAWEPAINFGSKHMLQTLMKQSMSFKELLKQYDLTPAKMRNAMRLQKLIKLHTGFDVTEAEAKRALEEEKNPFAARDKNAPKNWARIDDFDLFYPDVEDRRRAALGRMLASRQGVVFGTGAHTSTPVPIFARGSAEWIAAFGGVKTGAELGRTMQRVFLGQ